MAGPKSADFIAELRGLISKMHLRPFALNECKRYYQKRQFHLSHYEMVLAYMALGGIPYYLDLLRKERTVDTGLTMDVLFR